MASPRLRFPDILLSPIIGPMYLLGILYELMADPFRVGRSRGRALLDGMLDRAFEPPNQHT